MCLPYIDGYTESDNGYADLALYDIAPDGFVNLIKNAKYVCTDSFHCSVFSTILKGNTLCSSALLRALRVQPTQGLSRF